MARIRLENSDPTISFKSSMRQKVEPMSDENFERFKKCAVEVLSVDAGQVTMEASFADDLDADSLDLVEFVMALEEEFDVTVEEEELDGVSTIGAAYELVTSKL